MKRLAVATHTATINGRQYDGIGNSLRDTLGEICDEYDFVRHSMDGKIRSEIQICSGESMDVRNLHVLRTPAPFRYVSEIFSTVFHYTFKRKIDVYVGVDPLNALAGVFLKKIKRVDRAIFYTADYSTNRFGNKVMDWIYHRIDRYCVRRADEVWSVSTKIIDVRKRMGLSDKKNIFVPNVPPMKYNNLRKNKHNQYTLVTAGVIDKQLDYKGIFTAIAQLKNELPKLNMVVIGNGPEEDRIKAIARDLKIDDRVKFTGRLPLAEALDYVSRSGIGLALYTGVWGFNQYGDSTKCREFFTFGLPVISTDTHSTVDDIRQFKAGIIVEKTAKEYVAAIRNIIKNYDEFSRCSHELGLKYEGVHSRHLRRIIDTK